MTIDSQIGYSDGSETTAFGSLTGGSTTGLTLNYFGLQWTGRGGDNYAGAMVLICTGTSGPLPQNSFTSLAFTDSNGTAVTLDSSGAASYPGSTGLSFSFSQDGDVSTWTWSFTTLPVVRNMNNGTVYAVTVT